MTSIVDAPWWRRIEIHSSHYADGKRRCDWCDVQVFPKQQQHDAECPIAKILALGDEEEKGGA